MRTLTGVYCSREYFIILLKNNKYIKGDINFGASKSGDTGPLPDLPIHVNFLSIW